MLGQSLRVTECPSKAAQARRLHDAEPDPEMKLTYLHVEQCWHRLADIYAFMDRLEATKKSAPVQ
jgi:hypothetical protein